MAALPPHHPSSGSSPTCPDAPAPFRPFINALQAILADSRDRRLANAPDLDYTMAAEIIILIETLEQSG